MSQKGTYNKTKDIIYKKTNTYLVYTHTTRRHARVHTHTHTGVLTHTIGEV